MITILLSYLRRLYSLDTIDTRFTTNSKTPLHQTASEHGVDVSRPAIASPEQSNVKQDQALQSGTQPSRWRTPEYYFYYLVFIVMVPLMFKVPFDVSQGKTRIKTWNVAGLTYMTIQQVIRNIPNSSRCFQMDGFLVVKWCALLHF